MTRACRKVAQLFICERFVEIQVHPSYCLNWQEIENFLKLRKLIKRKLCDQEDLVFVFLHELWLYWIVFFFIDVSVGAWNEYRVAGSIVLHHASCLSSKLYSILFILANRAGTSAKQVQTHDPSPSFPKGINGRLTMASNLNISETWDDWFEFNINAYHLRLESEPLRLSDDLCLCFQWFKILLWKLFCVVVVIDYDRN